MFSLWFVLTLIRRKPDLEAVLFMIGLAAELDAGWPEEDVTVPQAELESLLGDIFGYGSTATI